MSLIFDISFVPSADISGGAAVLLKAAGDGLPAGADAADPDGVVARAASVASFKAKASATLDILAPKGSAADRLVVVGLGPVAGIGPETFLNAGGAAVAAVKGATAVTVFLDAPGVETGGDAAADFALGMLLRAYRFDSFKTKAGKSVKSAARDEAAEDKEADSVRVTIVTAAAEAAKAAFAERQAIAGGVVLARDLVNLPPNVLGPVEFAEKAKALEALGAEVEILTEKELGEIGMRALLGVAQGSARPARVAVIRWNGGQKDSQPLAFIGKGVVFDTGGISLKPGLNMEDMKGDMGGAAAVVGLLHVLAARQAKVNAVGVIGLVENMPDGNAQRPGDIVTSLSGQTIEIVNTDAEGRLVLCDILWYAKDRFAPKLMVDLATLTGAIGVALGRHHAGLFSNDDALSGELTAAGLATGEKLWRLPMGPEYDRIIDSRFADMKNSGGRHAGSITAAQFLRRFVGDTPWAHLDIAMTAMDSLKTDISQGWASGFGVRLLDEFVRAHHEA
ncbi:leucyl aminopeptidase [Rhizobiaceae bacterium BDR2-2]|uniref:Probable cytosol aminopeptidase n=1 Tax=Ectorhizobium quercum TaxID=2965071 RepID=A0AAE3N2K0_9HYPH|nr:leucyl aminopeptidase [Ectorhizobium quercum]MCX8999021.1 leucyl aminopeptidase [Ectorhizobium quercum]